MADLTFDRNSKTLTGFGKAWSAASGNGSASPLSPGLYLVPPHALMVGTEHMQGVPYNGKYGKPSYRDAKGFGWFMWLGKSDYGIHPDGGPSGTLGCIGVTSSDTRPLFDELAKKNGAGLSVEVR